MLTIALAETLQFCLWLFCLCLFMLRRKLISANSCCFSSGFETASSGSPWVLAAFIGVMVIGGLKVCTCLLKLEVVFIYISEMCATRLFSLCYFVSFIFISLLSSVLMYDKVNCLVCLITLLPLLFYVRPINYVISFVISFD